MRHVITPIEVVQRNLVSTGLTVVSKVPADRPDSFIRVDMAPPRRNNLIQYATGIIVQVYSTSLGTAIDTFDSVQADLEHMAAVDPLVSGWEEQNGPYEFPDPDLPDVHRWQMTGQLFHTLT